MKKLKEKTSEQFSEQKTFCGCTFRKRPTENPLGTPFSTYILSLDQDNEAAIELDSLPRVRIDAIRATDYEHFSQMMDGLVQASIDICCDWIFHAGPLDERMIAMFKEYGFVEQEMITDQYNRYLDLRPLKEVISHE